MVTVVDDKIAFSRDQVVSSTQVVKEFKNIRKKAQKEPLFVSDRNAGMDTVIISYDDFEYMVVELSKARDELLYAKAAERIAKADANPSHVGISLEEAIGKEAYEELIALVADDGKERVFSAAVRRIQR